MDIVGNVLEILHVCSKTKHNKISSLSQKLHSDYCDTNSWNCPLSHRARNLLWKYQINSENSLNLHERRKETFSIMIFDRERKKNFSADYVRTIDSKNNFALNF